MSERLYQAIGDISEKHIQEAEQWQAVEQVDQISAKSSVKRSSKGASGKLRWTSWGLAAACFALVMLLGGIKVFAHGEADRTVIGGVERNYKYFGASSAELAIVWPKEYQTIYERYNGMIFEGIGYRTRANAIGTEQLGEVLGSCIAQGYDIYTDTTYAEEFEVRRIRDVAPELLVAVGMEDQFYVYLRDEYDPPQTLGQLLDMAALPQTLTLDRFSVNEGHTAKGYYTMEDDSYIWQLLTECSDAPVIGEKESDDWDWGLGERNYLSFTATSEFLGIYKKVFYVTEDGYIKTNIFEYGYLYDIGEDVAGEIISYAKEHAVESEFEPYEYRLAGKLTVIEDDHVLIDDSMLCRDPSDGMVFWVPLDDIRVRRCIEFGGLTVGDIVVASFRGDIDVDAGNVIRGALSLEKGYLHDGQVAVPE